MVIEINDLTSTDKIQEVFHREYPYLKIELFSNAGKKQELVPAEKAIGSFREKHTAGKWKVHPANKIPDIERAFSDQFGLAVHVLRRRSTYWVTPDRNEYLTLEEQNKVGKMEAAE